MFLVEANLSLFSQLRYKLTTILSEGKAPLDVLAFSAISLGLIFVGSCNEEVAQSIIFALMERSESELGEPLTRLLPLSLGLLYLGKQVNYFLRLLDDPLWLYFLVDRNNVLFLVCFVLDVRNSLHYSDCFLKSLFVPYRKVWRLPLKFQRHSMRKSEDIVT